MDLKTYAKQNGVPVLQEESLAFLLDVLQSHHVKRFLEIGTAIGKTSLAVNELGIEVVTIERDAKMIEQAKKNLAHTKVKLIEADALEAMPEGLFDAIFIDAAKAQYQRFFERYEGLLSPQGIIITDNLSFHGLVQYPERTQNRNTKALVRKIKAYIDYLKDREDFETTFYELGDGLAVSKRKTKT